MQSYERFNYKKELIISAYINQVCTWMTFGLGLSAVAAFFTTNSEVAVEFVSSNLLIFIPLVLLELLVVFAIVTYIDEMSSLAATAVFVLYSVATGMGLAAVFIVVPVLIISNVFFVLSVTFLMLSMFGAVTKRDVTEQGDLLITASVGIGIAAFVTVFMQDSIVDFLVSSAAIVFFIVLVTYKRRKLHLLAMREVPDDEDTDAEQKDIHEASHYAIIGALILYIFR